MTVQNTTGRRRFSAVAHVTLVTLALLMALLLSACYAPLADSGEGSIAMSISLPGSIFAQETIEPGTTQNFVARVYVGNLAYEDLIRRFVAYDDFIDENYYSDVLWQAELDPEIVGVLENYYTQVEATMDDLEEDVVLKAATMFGGKPYYDVVLSVQVDGEGNATGGGSFTLPGIPAGRSYVVFFDVYEVGDQDKDDAEIVAYSRVWQSDPDPYEEMFEANGSGLVLDQVTGETDPEEALAAARAALQAVLSEYRNREKHPVSPVFVEAGKTVEIQLEVIVEPLE